LDQEMSIENSPKDIDIPIDDKLGNTASVHVESV
jgi:hypothetical protein